MVEAGQTDMLAQPMALPEVLAVEVAQGKRLRMAAPQRKQQGLAKQVLETLVVEDE